MSFLGSLSNEFAPAALLPSPCPPALPGHSPWSPMRARMPTQEDKSLDKRVGCMWLCVSVFTLQTDGVKLYRAPELFPSDSY